MRRRFTSTTSFIGVAFYTGVCGWEVDYQVMDKDTYEVVVVYCIVTDQLYLLGTDELSMYAYSISNIKWNQLVYIGVL